MWSFIVVSAVILVVIKIIGSKTVQKPVVNTHSLEVNSMNSNYFAYSNIKELAGIRLTPLMFGQAIAHGAISSNSILDNVSPVEGPFSSSLNGYEMKLQIPLVSLQMSIYITYIREVLKVSTAVIDDFKKGVTSCFDEQDEVVKKLFKQCLERYEEAHRREFDNPQKPLEPNQIRFGSPTVNLCIGDIKRLFQVDFEWDTDPNFFIFCRKIENAYGLFLILDDIKEMGIFYVE